ncbi:MAG: hypothetical protein EXQ90_08790 [Rhodospirillales bacterium]|nr:hypothetical protein [Rhodospirillales bacterium]
MSKIAYHHIGARGGSYPLPIRAPNPHLADFQFIFFDADPDCAEQVRAQLPDVAANTKVVPIAIGAEDGPDDLFITFDPY